MGHTRNTACSYHCRVLHRKSISLSKHASSDSKISIFFQDANEVFAFITFSDSNRDKRQTPFLAFSYAYQHSRLVPNTSSHTPFDHPPHRFRHQDVLPKSLLLQKLQGLKRRRRVRQIFGVFWLAEILKVVKVGDEGWVVEYLGGGEVVKVPRVC